MHKLAATQLPSVLKLTKNTRSNELKWIDLSIGTAAL